VVVSPPTPTPAPTPPLGTPGPSPTPPPKLRLIYKEFGREADTLWLTDIRLEEARRLVSIPHAPDFGILASLSPSGQEVAYTVLPPGALNRAREGELWILRLADLQSRKLLGGLDLQQVPLWSPDGDALAVRRYSPQGVAELVLVRKADGAVTVLVRGSGALDLFPVAFSPDGSYLYYIRFTPQGSELGKASPAGAVILGSLGKGLTRDWHLSPDGRLLAYLARQEVEGRIRYRVYVAPIGGEGKPLKVIGPLGPDHFKPLWHPQGREIAIGSTPAQEEGQGVFLVGAEGGEARPFGSPPARGFDVPVAWSPDGRILAVRSFSGTSAQRPGPSRYVLVFADGTRREMEANAEFIGWIP